MGGCQLVMYSASEIINFRGIAKFRRCPYDPVRGNVMYILSRRSAVIGACAAIALPSVVRAAISGPEYIGVWEAVNLTTGVTDRKSVV